MPTAADVTAAEDHVRAIVRQAIERTAEGRTNPFEPADAADSVLAALEDELPDGFDALLEHAHDRLARQLDSKET